MVSLWICMHRNTFNSVQFLEQKKIPWASQAASEQEIFRRGLQFTPPAKNNSRSYCSVHFPRGKARRVQLVGREESSAATGHKGEAQVMPVLWHLASIRLAVHYEILLLHFAPRTRGHGTHDKNGWELDFHQGMGFQGQPYRLVIFKNTLDRWDNPPSSFSASGLVLG